MQIRYGVGFVAALTAVGCWSFKHETSAPHTSVQLEVSGVRTRELPAGDFEDGWSVKFERFRLAPLFGIDDSLDNRKNDGYVPLTGAPAYESGGHILDLTSADPVEVFEAWIVSGRSGGWGMRLRTAPVTPGDLDRGARTPPLGSLEVAGEATGPEGRVVRFSWAFARELVFAHCVAPGEGQLVLPENGMLDVKVELDGGALFGDPSRPLRFAEIAAADADGDGLVTTAELLGAPPDGTLTASDSCADETNLYGSISARLAGLVGPSYVCQPDVLSCDDTLLAAGGGSSE